MNARSFVLRRVRLARPVFDSDDIEFVKKRVERTLKSGWLTTGPLVQEFEEKFGEGTHTKFAIAVNSGTAALHVLTAFQHLTRGDEVIVPADTFASTANAAVYEGATPVLADCDLETFNVTAETIEAQVTKKTKAVIVTHVGGNPCEMDEIAAFCKERDLVLMEDAAHAVGSSFRGRACGSLSFASAFSLYPNKIITSAEGGFVCTDSQELDSFARKFRNAGRLNFGRGPVEILGYNYRMSEVHAALGLSQFRHVKSFVKLRNRLAKQYEEQLSKIDWISPQRVSENGFSSYYVYIVRLLPGAPIPRDKLAKRMKEKGVETTVTYVPIHKMPYFKAIGRPQRLPNAEEVGKNSLTLPIYPGMTAGDVEYVVKALKEVD